tara:strand:+ start:3210 stop:4325 length:1116 start_codon:yes stop_codon:yes gene_type:complete
MPITVKRSASSYHKSNPQPTDSPVGAYGAKLMATQNAAQASALVGPTGFKNHIINGDFRIWQRGTTGATNTTTGIDSADRFWVNKSSGTGYGSRFTFTRGDKYVPGNPTYGYKLTCTVGNNNMGVLQKIEDVRAFLGRYVTLSFWAKGTNPGGGHFKSSWIKSYDSAANNGEWTIADNIVLNEDWQFYSFTTKVPNAPAAQTINDTESYLWCDILRQPGDDTSTNPWEIYLANVQLEYGTQPTEFEFRPMAVELALCHRFFYRATKLGSTSEVTNRPICLGFYFSNSEIRGVVDFPVEMRAQPSLSSNDNSSSYYIQRNSGADMFDRLELYIASKKRCSVRNYSHVSGTAGNAGLISQETGDSILTFNAEL